MTVAENETLLTTDQKTFIVQQLAMWRTPSQIVEMVKDTFGVEISRQRAQYYHPEHNNELAQKWAEVFHATRKKFLDTVSDIPIANQAYRVQQLQDSLNRQLRMPRTNEAMVQNILEQAAKEVGGMFTNRREVTGANGKPLLDPVEMARIVMRDLVEQGVFDEPGALAWVAKQYSISESVLVSDANN